MLSKLNIIGFNGTERRMINGCTNLDDRYGHGDENGYGNGYGEGYGRGNGDGLGYGFGSLDGIVSGSKDKGDCSGSGDGNGLGDGRSSYERFIENTNLSFIADLYQYVKTVDIEISEGSYFFGKWWIGSANYVCILLRKEEFNLVDRNFLKSVTNIESLRVLQEKIGLNRYAELLDLHLIDKRLDNYYNEMELYEYEEIGQRVIILKVICPSTGRIYFIHPPNQKAQTCYEAKQSLFNKPITYRHGDVGLHLINSKNKLKYES